MPPQRRTRPDSGDPHPEPSTGADATPRGRARRRAAAEAGWSVPGLPGGIPPEPDLSDEPVLMSDPTLAAPARAFERLAERREMQLAALAEARRTEIEDVSDRSRRALEKAVAKLVEALQESADEARAEIQRAAEAERKGLARAVVDRIESAEEEMAAAALEQLDGLEQALGGARNALAEEVAKVRAALEDEVTAARGAFDQVGVARAQQLEQRAQLHLKNLESVSERERSQIVDAANSATAIVDQRTADLDAELAARVDEILSGNRTALTSLITGLRDAERTAQERVLELDARTRELHNWASVSLAEIDKKVERALARLEHATVEHNGAISEAIAGSEAQVKLVRDAVARAVTDASTALEGVAAAQLEAFERSVTTSRTQTMQAIGAVREQVAELRRETEETLAVGRSDLDAAAAAARAQVDEAVARVAHATTEHQGAVEQAIAATGAQVAALRGEAERAVADARNCSSWNPQRSPARSPRWSPR